MPVVDLRYGTRTIPFEYDPDQFQILAPGLDRPAMSDVEIGTKLDSPIGAESLEHTIEAGQSVLIVVPDATRQNGAGQVVNLLVRRLIASGVNAFDIRIIFATGIHRPVTEAEKLAILTPFIAQRIKSLDHNPRDLMQIARLGETSGSIPVELNRALLEHDHVILVGGVSFHYFAGFTGGRKLVCPGLASTRTVSATHKLAFDCLRKERADGVGPGLLVGNPVHASFIEAAGKVPISFCVTTEVNEAGDVNDFFCGDWISSHQAACDSFAADHTAEITEKRELVIVSCGGAPHDINMIQAHKALESAAGACIDGGTIVLIAECSEGTGRSDFLEWFQSADSSALANKLCEKYQVNGQTAWSILKKAERFDVRIITSLPAESTEMMRLTAMQSLARAVSKAGRSKAGYILPFGAKTLVRQVSPS